MEPTEVDPYAPPKAALTGTDNTTYLKEDGYAFQNELVANQHFKSPLICAKLGIPIPLESNPEPKEITVIRAPSMSKSFTSGVTLFSFLLLILCIAYIDFDDAAVLVVGYIILTRILRRLFSRPYKIPFYFSEQYTRIRARRKLTFNIILLTFIALFLTGYFTENDTYIVLSLPAILITLVIYKFITTYFVVTQTKGEFHYIRGAHRDLLDALPYLPISP
jgi:hypothetical protein